MKAITSLFAVIVLLTPAAPVYAQTTTAVSGTGTGMSRCNSTSPVFPATISFSVTSVQGTPTGSYSISFTSGGTASPITGVITGGHVNGHHYILDGQMTQDLCIAVGTGSFPTTSIEGRCGTGVSIAFKVGRGPGADWGTFTGDVTCG